MKLSSRKNSPAVSPEASRIGYAKTRTSQLRKRFAVFALSLLVIIPAIFALSFLSNPQFNSGALVFTDETLTCAWSYSGDTTAQNITLLRDGQVYLTQNETGGSLNTSISVTAVNTTKNEVWTCSVILDNGTSTTSYSRNVTIQNSAPETPIVYVNGSVDIGNSYNVSEDITYIFDVNSSDDDLDTLLYYFKTATQGFCTMTDSAAGLASCTPTQSDHNGSATELNITFWVDDDDVSFAKSASSKVSFLVIPVNDAPTASPVLQTTPVNTTLVYDFDASDEETNTPFTFALVNISAEIIGKTTISSLDADTARFTYDASTPDYTDVNTSGWNITVNITDTGNASTLVSFLLNITPVGRVPQIFNISPAANVQGFHEVLQGQALQINFSANDSDTNAVHTFSDNASNANLNMTTVQSLINVSNESTATLDYFATNDDVGQFSVRVTVTDEESLTDSVIINISVINVNDAPNLYTQSFTESNTNANTNLSNITSYVGAAFQFTVNASDIDVQHGDTLTYADNTTLFDINSSTGVISFTPLVSQVSATPYSINISVSDNESLIDFEIIEFWILNNTPPYFQPFPLNDTTCIEGSSCTYDLSVYATEDDGGDSISAYAASAGNLSSFNYSNTTGLISFIPIQAEVGNYTVFVNITDTRGATNTTNFTLQVNNSPDPPVLITYDFSGSTIVEDHLFSFQVQAQDADLLAPGSTENLTFSTNVSEINFSSYSTSSNATFALLELNASAALVGTISVNLTVTDTQGGSNSQIISATILPDSDAPDIQFIQPYGNTSNSSFPVESFINTTITGSSTALAFSENTSYLFAHLTQDDLTAQGSLLTNWYYDDVLVASTWNYTRAFNFTSSGTHILRLRVNDTYLDYSEFLWNITIANINRGPELLNNLVDPPDINATTVITNYLSRYLSVTRFIDPDDDINDDDVISGSETDTITYTATTCLNGTTTVATMAFSGASVTFTPVAVGSCSIVFTATDASGATATSNAVTLNVTSVPEAEETTVTVSSSGGGGSSSTRTTFVPLQNDVESPEPLSIVAPKIVKLYDNNSVIIPFDIVNTWEEDLSFITLSAESNATGVEMKLSSNVIESLGANETASLTLELINYRFGDNYEVLLRAAVEEPAFEDTALVVLASIEQGTDGEAGFDVKVTFAKDLFNDNPECQELTELLVEAEKEVGRGNIQEGLRMVNSAISGCKYMVSRLEQRVERPSLIPASFTLDELTFRTLLYSFLAFLIFVTLAFIIYYHYTHKEEDDI